jgi:hypothetical protein
MPLRSRAQPRMAAVAAGLAATPTPSYWIENTDTDFTTPTPLPTEADYCVVGGGLTGVSTAYWLNKMGHSCVLVEGRGLAGGASGRNGGVLSGSSEFQQANIEMLRAIMEEHGGAEHFEYRQGGYLRVALEGSEAAREYREARLDPERQELWTAERCARELGTDKIDGLQIACGVFGRTSGHFWPAKMVHAIAAGARMTTFCTHTRALSIGSDERPAQEGGDSSGSSGELREFGSSEPAQTHPSCVSPQLCALTANGRNMQASSCFGQTVVRSAAKESLSVRTAGRRSCCQNSHRCVVAVVLVVVGMVVVVVAVWLVRIYMMSPCADLISACARMYA